MRSANLIIVALGVAAVLGAVVIAWRWRTLPLVAPDRVPPGRALVRDDLAPELASATARRTGHIVVAVATILAAIATGDAIVEIIAA
jgi:hypothetical protein